MPLSAAPKHLRPRRVLWLAGYTLVVAAPLLVLLPTGLLNRRGAGFWFDFSMGLGFGTLSLLGGQFLLTARFRRVTAPFGTDVVYLFHRWLAVGAVLLGLAHCGILRAAYPATLTPWRPDRAPLHMTAGRVALAIFVMMVVSSLWRVVLRLEYDRWRVAHAVLAISGMVLALVHIHGIDYYTGTFWTQSLVDLFVASLVGVVAYVRVIRPALTTASPYRVASVRPEHGAVTTLELVPEGHEGMRFLPGQFGWLSLGHAPWRADEHPFSFSSAPRSDGSLAVSIKALGDFTATVADTPVGTVAYVDGPHGIFSVDLHPDANGFFFLAGGIGIAPVMSMLRALAERGDARPVRLVYGNRLWDGAAFREELAALHERMDLEVTHVLQEPAPGWTGAVGLPGPDVIASALDTLPRGVRCFLCGPVPLTRMAQDALRSRGVPTSHVHLELFQMA